MTVEIKVEELTTYSIACDGSSVVLRLTDQTGQPVALTFDIQVLGTLAMTLPTLIEAALRRQYRDASFRYTHPIGDWSIEQSNEPTKLIVTMKTKDGFGVSFSLPRMSAKALGGALSEAVAIASATALH